MEALQRSLVEVFMRQMSQVKSPDPSVMSFWQSMSEQSSEMFEHYKKTVMGGADESKKHT